MPLFPVFIEDLSDFVLSKKIKPRWCRDRSINDRVMRAVTGTLRQLVFQSFYCEQWAIDSTIERVAGKMTSSPPDFELLRCVRCH